MKTIVSPVLASALVIIAVLVGCEPPRQVEKTVLDPASKPSRDSVAIFAPVRRVAAEIESAQDVGLSRNDFQAFLQRFATELSVVKEDVSGQTEQVAYNHYAKALEIWKHSAMLWDAAIEMPSLPSKGDRWWKEFALSDMKLRESLMEYEILIGYDKLPIESYPKKTELPISVLAKAHGIPITEEKGWHWIPADSYKKLWLKANEETAEAQRELKAGAPVSR